MVLEEAEGYRRQGKGGEPTERPIGGKLPLVVHLGLYGGLRDEEMVWATWEKLNPETGVYRIEETVCEATGRRWDPKSYARQIRLQDPLLDLLRAEERTGQFLLGGDRPLHHDTPQHAFRDFARAIKLPSDVTLYHTCATWLLRPKDVGGAGWDIRTVQQFLGHVDVQTTMIYLRAIEAEEQDGGSLRY